MTGIQILGMLAGTITSITFLPQVIKVWKSRSAKDLSLVMLVLLMAGVSLWLVYGLVIMDGAIIYTNSMVLIMTLILLFFIFNVYSVVMGLRWPLEKLAK